MEETACSLPVSILPFLISAIDIPFSFISEHVVYLET